MSQSDRPNGDRRPVWPRRDTPAGPSRTIQESNRRIARNEQISKWVLAGAIFFQVLAAVSAMIGAIMESGANP